jgi:hypothetical protein
MIARSGLMRQCFGFFQTKFYTPSQSALRYPLTIMDHEHQHAAAPSIGGDILHGADGIAAFLYGNEKFRRKIYNLVETKRLPHFRLGNMICARKSVLLAWITAQEETSNTQVVS